MDQSINTGKSETLVESTNSCLESKPDSLDSFNSNSGTSSDYQNSFKGEDSSSLTLKETVSSTLDAPEPGPGDSSLPSTSSIDDNPLPPVNSEVPDASHAESMDSTTRDDCQVIDSSSNDKADGEENFQTNNIIADSSSTSSNKLVDSSSSLPKEESASSCSLDAHSKIESSQIKQEVLETSNKEQEKGITSQGDDDKLADSTQNNVKPVIDTTSENSEASLKNDPPRSGVVTRRGAKKIDSISSSGDVKNTTSSKFETAPTRASPRLAARSSRSSPRIKQMQSQVKEEAIDCESLPSSSKNSFDSPFNAEGDSKSADDSLPKLGNEISSSHDSNSASSFRDETNSGEVSCSGRSADLHDALRTIKSEPSDPSSSPSQSHENSCEIKSSNKMEESKLNKTSASSINQDSNEGRSSSKKEGRSCAECSITKGLKYQVVFQGKTRFLCSDVCFQAFRNKQKLAPSSSSEKCSVCKGDIKQGYLAPVGDGTPLCSEKCMNSRIQQHLAKRVCALCKTAIASRQQSLVWEAMEFCGETCLGHYQSANGSHCTCCKSIVPSPAMGKYCVRFGMEVRQFCSGRCLEDFKKGLKVCSFCQKDISQNSNAFLAPVGDKGQFKDFCTHQCLERYEKMYGNSSTKQPKQKCSVCANVNEIKVQLKYKNSDYNLCSDACVASFRYANKITTSICDTCHNFFEFPPPSSKDTAGPIGIHYEGNAKSFCSKSCMSLFVLTHRKIVPCLWCKVKKYNFDMIERMDPKGTLQLFCSLNCLSLFRVSLNATSSRTLSCDNCHKALPPQYHLTMSDASIRNFCSYPCVLHFQSQFSNSSPTTTSTGKASSAPTPVISSVRSLAGAPPPKPNLPKLTPISTKANAMPNATSPQIVNSTTNSTTAAPQIIREVIIKPPPPTPLKNKSTLCKPITATKGVSCKPLPCHKGTQTEGGLTGLLPIPVPIFVPTPAHMFSRAVPTPFPFPVPLPVPVFIPTPYKTFQHLNANIQALLEKSDPSESSKVASDNKAPSPVSPGSPTSLKRKAEDSEVTAPENTKRFRPEETKEKEVDIDLSLQRESMAERLKSQIGVDAFHHWVRVKSSQIEESNGEAVDILDIDPRDLSLYLSLFIKELRPPPGSTSDIYAPDILYYVCLGLQAHLSEHGRQDKLFADPLYERFNTALTEVLSKSSLANPLTDSSLRIIGEEMLWASKELGAHSPQVLINTILFFTTRGFNLHTAEEHAEITFGNLSKRKAKGGNQAHLKYYPPVKAGQEKPKGLKDDLAYKMLPENIENPMKCPVKFYEFYLSKCPDKAKAGIGPFYLAPEKSCTPDSQTWFSCEPLGLEAISTMLLRINLVRESPSSTPTPNVPS